MMTFKTLAERVAYEQDKRQPSEVKQMNLDRAKFTSFEGLSEEFVNLELLSLVHGALESLKGMPKLPSLKILELTHNSISGGLDDVVNCPALEQLNLTSNKISTIEALTPLAKLSNLRSLDLFDCEITQIENYRKVVFAALPNLKYLDGLDENNVAEPGVLPNGGAYDENGDGEDDDDSDENDTDDDEEYGIEALQRSEDLEDDDEEDYAPGEEEEAELDEYDDLDDEEDDEIEDDGANLSGAGVTGPRRPSSKRRHDTSDHAAPDGESEPVAKHKVNEDNEAHDE